jgi:hypothetical protein
MASTRNKNTLGNYKLEVREDKKVLHYSLNEEAGVSYSTHFPGAGLMPGQLPRQKLSGNPIDIESFLFGINATNLVVPGTCLVPEIKELKPVNIYKKPENVIMPYPLVIDRNRPFPCP